MFSTAGRSIHHNGRVANHFFYNAWNCKTCLDKKVYAWKSDRTINENENEISASIVSQFFFFEL